MVNHNYLLAYKLTDFLIALTMMRAGVRRNNADAMLAGRQRLAPVFFAGQHMLYQRLIMRDMLQRVQAPAKVQRYLRETTSYSMSGDDTRGEGADFLLEAKNRDTRAWLPPGKIIFKISAMSFELVTAISLPTAATTVEHNENYLVRYVSIVDIKA